MHPCSVNLELNFLILFNSGEVITTNSHVGFLILTAATRIKISTKKSDISSNDKEKVKIWNELNDLTHDMYKVSKYLPAHN